MTTLPTNDEKWLLPERLRLDTPEKLAAAGERQRELAAKINSPFASVTPEERERGRAARIVVEHKATAELLKSVIVKHEADRFISPQGMRELAAATEAYPVILSQLAEAHATTGRFDLASEAEPDRKRKAHYLRVWRAVWRDDAHWCACPKTTAGHTQAFVKQDIWSVKHNAQMSLMKCNGCACMNVAPLKRELAEQRAHRRTAAALASNLSPNEAKRVLKERGHTTRELMK